MGRPKRSEMSVEIAGRLFAILEREKIKSGLTVDDFMFSIGFSKSLYQSLSARSAPTGTSLLQLIYMLDMDQSEIGKLIDIAGKYCENRASRPSCDAPVHATPKTAKPASA